MAGVPGCVTYGVEGSLVNVILGNPDQGELGMDRISSSHRFKGKHDSKALLERPETLRSLSAYSIGISRLTHLARAFGVVP